MERTQIQSVAKDVPSLRAVFVTAMPDCLLFDSWMRAEESWVAEDAASYFGDLVRANREGLKALKSWSSEMQVTIESADVLLVLKELRSDFVVTLAFQRDAPLGMVRMYTKRMLEHLDALLPKLEVKERPRGVRVREFLEKYAPDPHAALARIALRTGIALEALKKSEGLTPGQVEIFETSVKDLLGLDSLPA
jgi:predicted regulator of Ras-like GTPase activity (Roadblock/LC7/MglB family)